MVRLEKFSAGADSVASFLIYIPVWLDQKSKLTNKKKAPKKRFTFQYGQIRKGFIAGLIIRKIRIYIPVWLDQKS